MESKGWRDFGNCAVKTPHFPVPCPQCLDSWRMGSWECFSQMYAPGLGICQESLSLWCPGLELWGKYKPLNFSLVWLWGQGPYSHTLVFHPGFLVTQPVRSPTCPDSKSSCQSWNSRMTPKSRNHSSPRLLLLIISCGGCTHSRMNLLLYWVKLSDVFVDFTFLELNMYTVCAKKLKSGEQSSSFSNPGRERDAEQKHGSWDKGLTGWHELNVPHQIHMLKP